MESMATMVHVYERRPVLVSLPMPNAEQGRYWRPFVRQWCHEVGDRTRDPPRSWSTRSTTDLCSMLNTFGILKKICEFFSSFVDQVSCHHRFQQIFPWLYGLTWHFFWGKKPYRKKRISIIWKYLTWKDLFIYVFLLEIFIYIREHNNSEKNGTTLDGQPRHLLLTEFLVFVVDLIF